jgi:glycosyltransferase 2 family protein
MPRFLHYVFVILGVVLLGVIAWHTDLAEVGARLADLGWTGALAVVAVYFVAFVCDTAVWMAALTARAPSARLLAQLWQVRVIGEAVNSATPLGSVGGEPVKALLLRKYFGVGLRDGIASLVLAKTAILVGLTLFLAAGFAMMLATDRLPETMKLVAGLGLGAFATAIVALVLVQWFRLASRAATWVSGLRYGAGLKRSLEALSDMDRQLSGFYRAHRGRLVPAVALSIANWLLGAAEVMVVMWFLGYPISFADAVMVEALTQLVRAGTFFIPMSLGAQEGTLMLALGSLTGAPAIGLAVAIVRRGRELLWILLGLLLFWSFSPRAAHHDAPDQP